MKHATDELTRRHDALRAGLADRGVGCAIITSEANFTYLTGLRLDPLWSSAARSLACIVPSSGPIGLVVPNFISDDALQAFRGVVVSGYDPPRESIQEPLARSLQSMSSGVVGWEAGSESRMGLPLDSADHIRATMKDRRFEDISGLMWELRMRKSPAELEAIAGASNAGSAAFEAVFAEGVAGRSEREIVRALARHALENGADRAEWVACTSGAGSYHRFVAAARNRMVEVGDLFWADIGLTCGGYWTDFCRAAVAGAVSSERTSIQRRVIEATAVGVDLCRPGTPVSHVAAAIRRRMADLGIDTLEYGRLGHGIGLSSTEPPSIAEWDHTVLEAGMVVTIEPAVSHDSGIYCAEQVVAVTDGAPEVLTLAPNDLTQA